ncbi:pentapeptide repeat-containing protein [Streptomyces sp. NRRL F-2664]|uniref:pentapeptide repeat-containing protein n=1 Tax=Streptomyces sp. NRRL F-2664 TaxID=1463842 RepID=UPI0004CAE056|nr:pentapeptide repeat-containing protein [Streptomyces sp. NRRL F-2664]
MIEDLLAALADGAGVAGPRPGIGAEEVADILWLAARVDPAGPRPPPVAPDDVEPEPPPAAEAAASEEPAAAGGPADGRPAVKLFPASLPHPAGKPADDGVGRRGTPVRLPRAASLDDPLALMRALRPVGRRSIGGPGEELDEQLTVERSIERMVPTPVLRPAESRWLDLALVVDTHHSMLLWADLVDELRRVLTRSGVFRDVRTWQLTGTGPGAVPMLTRGRSGPPRHPLELADPAGRRLILVLSDTVAGGWREASVQGVLRHWCTHNAVAVLNVLPERLWTRGAVRPVPFAVRADRPAAATRSWQRAATARRSRPRTGRARPVDVVPVVGVAPGSLARLVRVVSGDGRWRRLACLRLDAEPGSGGPREAPAGGVRSALEVVERFRAGASPTAQQLAAHLAAVPLTLPVMNLVRRSLLRDSEHGHLAEVALGGLFAPWDHERSAEEVEFEFLPGVREALLGSQLRGEVAAVRELVRRRVWEYMSRNRGTGPDFSATRVTDGREGRRRVAEGALPFATQPPQDPGLADRVVRVRYHGLPEPLEVGTLLTPRLVLTVGDAAPGAIGWVRAGEREVSCRAVWWDDALPRVFLLLADEDLTGPASRLDPLPWWPAEVPQGRVRIDGRTDQGDAVALTGEVVPYEGARNGELVRLSAEPEVWTHYRGGPVSRDGALVGVVHGVWPDRMVFLSGEALLHQPGFRAAVADHTRTGPPEQGDGAPALWLAVRARDGSRPEAEVADLLERLMQDTGVTGRLAVVERGAPLLVLLEAPDALGQAGRLLTALPRSILRSAERTAGGRPVPWDAALAEGPGETLSAGSRITGQAASEAVRIVRHPALADRHLPAPGALAVALSQRVYEALGEKVGPTATRALVPLGGEGEGWVSTDPEGLGAALAEAAGSQDAGVDWPTCGRRSAREPGTPCRGRRLPGHDVCLAHLGPDGEHAYLGTLGPGSPVDFRGTTFEEGLLQRLLAALRGPRSQPVRLGEADFDHATFVDDWNEGGIEFLARASFARAVFAGQARLGTSTFAGPVSFDGAVFLGVGDFDHSRFHRASSFRRTHFHGLAGFSDSVFLDEVSFARSVLETSADLNGMRVAAHADFSRAVFGGLTGLSRASFAGPVSFAATTWELGLVATGAVFEGPVDFGGAVFRGRVRLEQLRLREAPEFALQDRPGRWGVHRRPDDSWDIHLLVAGAQ